MKKVLFVLSNLTLTLSLLRAQPTAVQQAETTVKTQEEQRRIFDLKSGTLTPELYPGENEDVGPQRILKLKPRHQWIAALVDSQFSYTSNARLAQNGESSTLFVNTVEASVTPPTYSVLNYDIATRGGLRFQWYNYGLDGTESPLSLFDFHAQTVFAEESFAPAEKWRAALGVEATRLLHQGEYDEFYKELAPNWGVARYFPISNDKVFVASYKGYYRVTETLTPFSANNDRTDHSITLAYSQQIYPKLLVQPFYRFQYTHFIDSPGRNDIQNTVGVFLTYNVCANASVRTFALYDNRDTDQNTLASDYDKFDAGLGVMVNVRF